MLWLTSLPMRITVLPAPTMSGSERSESTEGSDLVRRDLSRYLIAIVVPSRVASPENRLRQAESGTKMHSISSLWRFPCDE